MKIAGDLKQIVDQLGDYEVEADVDTSSRYFCKIRNRGVIVFAGKLSDGTIFLRGVLFERRLNNIFKEGSGESLARQYKTLENQGEALLPHERLEKDRLDRLLQIAGWRDANGWVWTLD